MTETEYGEVENRVELFGDEKIQVGDIVIFQDWEYKVSEIIVQQDNGCSDRFIEFIDEHTGEQVFADEQFDSVRFFRDM